MFSEPVPNTRFLTCTVTPSDPSDSEWKYTDIDDWKSPRDKRIRHPNAISRVKEHWVHCDSPQRASQLQQSIRSAPQVLHSRESHSSLGCMRARSQYPATIFRHSCQGKWNGQQWFVALHRVSRPVLLPSILATTLKVQSYSLHATV